MINFRTLAIIAALREVGYDANVLVQVAKSELEIECLGAGLTKSDKTYWTKLWQHLFAPPTTGLEHDEWQQRLDSVGKLVHVLDACWSAGIRQTCRWSARDAG